MQIEIYWTSFFSLRRVFKENNNSGSEGMFEMMTTEIQRK